MQHKTFNENFYCLKLSSNDENCFEISQYDSAFFVYCHKMQITIHLLTFFFGGGGREEDLKLNLR